MSNWFLYIGVFLCASGIGLVVGLIFIAYWGIKTLEESKQGNSYTENYTENHTENNFTANIDHYHAGDDGSGDDDWRKSGHVSGAIGEDVSRDYVSKDTLEDGR